MRYGMSDKLGSVTFESGHDEVFIGRSMAQAKSYSEEVAALIDGEVRALIDGAYARCEDILTRCRRELEITARYLLDHEVMEGRSSPRCLTTPRPRSWPPTGRTCPEIFHFSLVIRKIPPLQICSKVLY